MGANIITKTDRQMEDHMHAVSSDPMRADTLQKARAFKRTWIELADALTKVQAKQSWEAWGYPDFDTYCRKELHLRGATVQMLLGSYRFLETSAPRAIARVPSLYIFNKIVFGHATTSRVLIYLDLRLLLRRTRRHAGGARRRARP